jgi:hypothetical protein
MCTLTGTKICLQVLGAAGNFFLKSIKEKIQGEEK